MDAKEWKFGTCEKLSSLLLVDWKVAENMDAIYRKAAIERTEMLDFLKEIVDPIQDPYPNGADEGAAGVGPDGKKKRGPRKKKEPVD